MAATSAKTNSFIPDFEAAAERTRDANEHLAQVGRKVTAAYLDGVENYVADFAKFERKLGEETKVGAVSSLLSTHAQLTEELAKASFSVARELITA